MLQRLKAEHISPTRLFGRGSRSMWRLSRGLKMEHGTVPKGFISDGVTIPFWLFFIAKPTGKLFEPAVWHDYQLSLLDPKESRAQADLEFRHECYRYGASKIKTESLYRVVRLFGIIKVFYTRGFK